MYIEGIIERLNNPYLHNPNNEGRKVLDGTIGEYLEHYNNHFMDLWICRANGKYLDLLGNLQGIIRQENESDASYRNRIKLDISIVDSLEDIRKAGVQLYVSTDAGFGAAWTSDNLYLTNNEYFAVSSEDTKKYIKDKFIMEDIEWVIS